MAEVDWIILSENSIIEHGTGRLSMIGLSEEVSIKKLPFTLPKLCVNLRLVGDPDELVKISIGLIAPSGIVALNTSGDAKFDTAGRVLTTYLAFKGIDLRELGPYEIRLSINGVPAKSTNFLVSVR